MLRIVAVEPCPDPNREFVVLQNRGFMMVDLRGHVLHDDKAAEGARGAVCMLTDDVRIPSSAYVLVTTGKGTNGWARCSDGSPVYQVFLGLAGSLWLGAATVHLAAPSHKKNVCLPESASALSPAPEG
ncbi:MAG: hypothetical protein KatS3mg015_0538 [Fimbriimonadales bacterium]|jgi:hypothetical protein|nr:MAG: hypothetical protein KatS3mg015_0538 [Fimbriimonadales bacterium]